MVLAKVWIIFEVLLGLLLAFKNLFFFFFFVAIFSHSFIASLISYLYLYHRASVQIYL